MTITAARLHPPRVARLANLDGVRAIAIAGVLAYHVAVPGAFAGRLGVDVFFSLSGYLITGLLLREIDRSGRIRLRMFYARRMLRLYPALLATVVLTICFHAHLFASLTEWAASAGAALSYLTNFFIGYGHASRTNPLTPTWSLALEEQFYVLWPLVLLALLRICPTRRVAALAVGLMATASWMRLAADGVGRGYFRPDTAVGALLIGCAAALLLDTVTIDARNAAHLAKAALVVSVVAIAVASVKGGEILGNGAGIPLISVATALSIPWLLHAPVRGLAHPTMVWLGRRSYGLYLVHYPVLFALREVGMPGGWAALGAVTAALSIGVAAAMYRFVEQPALAWRDQHLAA